jgi:hypothetical protein
MESGERKQRGARTSAARSSFRHAARITTAHDATTNGRAEAVFQEEFAKWQGLIDAAAGDLGLSRDQRAAAVTALRVRQHAAAKAARHRAIEDDRQTERAARRARRRLTAPRPRAMVHQPRQRVA